MIENACVKCKYFFPCVPFGKPQCHKGEMKDDEIYGERFVFKYKGDVKKARSLCQGKDFEPFVFQTRPPKKTRFQRFVDKLLSFFKML